MTHLTRAGVTPYRYANVASIHRDRGKPNWFCQFYDPEGYRRNRTTGTENPKTARTICVNIGRGVGRPAQQSDQRCAGLARP
jgi:hypothetical protein